MKYVVCYGVLVWAIAPPSLAMAQAVPDDDGVRAVMPDPEEEQEPVAWPTAPLGTVTYEQHAASSARQGGASGTVAMDQLAVSSGFPVFFDGPRTMLAVGLMYARTTFDYDGGAAAVGPSIYHTFKATLTFRHDFDARWGLLVRYVPNLSTNMNDVTMGHVTHNGQLIGTYQLGPNETFYFGVAFSQAIPWYVLPGAGYEVFTGPWHLELRAPEKIEAGYMLTPRVEIGGTARYQNTLFGIGGASQLDHVSYTTAWLGGTIDVRLFAGLHLRAALGRTVLRRFRGMNDGASTSSIALEQTMVGRMALSYEIDRSNR